MRHYNNRRKPPAAFLVGALFTGILSLLLPLLAIAAPAPDDIVVVAVKGDVQVISGGATQVARAGSTLDLPAAIRTGSDGSIDLRQGDTTVGVGPDTQLDFPAPVTGAGAIDRVVQPGGNAYYNVGPRGKNRLRVETPYLVAVIKGTQFNVTVTPDSSTISLHEGRLEVLATETGIAAVELNAGEVAVRKRGEKTIRVLQVGKAAPPAAASAGGGDDDRGDSDDGTVTALVPSGKGGEGPEVPGDDSPLAGDVGEVFSPVDGGVTVDVDIGVGGLGDTPIGADAGIDAGIDLGAVGADVGADVGVDLGAATIDVGVDAGIDLGAVGADVGADVGVDLGAGTVDAGVDAGVDLGPASVDAGVDAGVDLGAGTVDLAADAGVDLGPAGVDVAADAGADLGAGTVDAGIDAGVDLGGGVEADLGADAGVDAGAGSVDASVDAGVAGADVGVDVGVDLTGADAGLDIGIDVLGTGIDLGLGGTAPGSDGAAVPQNDNSGGLLGGILGRPRL